MTEIKVSQLTEASEINDNDLLMIVQNGENKKITKENCKFASGDEIYVGDTEPTGDDTESLKLWLTSDDAIGGSGFELNKIYPIGSIYINTTGVNPSTFLGGTWEAFGSGKVLVGQDTEDTNFDTLLETGGDMTHKHLSPFIVDNRYNWSKFQWNTTVDNGYVSAHSANTNVLNSTPNSDGFDGYKLYGSSESSLQPYIVVSMWVRTA